MNFFLAAFAYWTLFLLTLSGENPILVGCIAGLFTALLILIHSGAYHRLIKKGKS